MASSNKNPSFYVVFNPDRKGWDVKREISGRSSGFSKIKQDATKFGRRKARESKTELFILRKNGSIAERNDYRNV